VPEFNPSPVIVLTVDGHVQYANPGAERLLIALGFDAGDTVRLLPADAVERLPPMEKDARAHWEYPVKSGRLACDVAADPDSGAFWLFLSDITEHRRNEEALHRLAYFDALTGLPNRTKLLDELHLVIRDAKQTDQPFALLVIDLDTFKKVSYTLGHQHGDLLLQQVAQRLGSVLGDSAMIARFGEDEFVVTLPNADHDAALRLSTKFIDALSPMYSLAGLLVDAPASIGVALYPEHGDTDFSLIQHAYIAIHRAREGNKPIAVYDPANDNYTTRRLTLLTDLRQAINRGGDLAMRYQAKIDLNMHYQPTIDLNRKRVCGVEALIRWQHADQGLILPDKFIPEAEQTPLIEPLTLWVLNDVLRTCRNRFSKLDDLRVSINLSARNLNDPELPDMIAGLLSHWGIEPGVLILEITESALMIDRRRAMDTLNRLHQMGLGVSIDDFGTGYSSLAYLSKLPVDELKIDRSFITQLENNPGNASIVESTIQLAHHLGMRVVAEGVETQAELDMLNAYGCDMVQGYLFSQPLVIDQFLDWLKARIL